MTSGRSSLSDGIKKGKEETDGNDKRGRKDRSCRRIARTLISHFLMQVSAHETTAISCKDPREQSTYTEGKRGIFIIHGQLLLLPSGFKMF